MEKWNKSGSDTRHHFSITDPETKTTPRVTGQTTGQTYEEWKKLLVHVTHPSTVFFTNFIFWYFVLILIVTFLLRVRQEQGKDIKRKSK